MWRDYLSVQFDPAHLLSETGFELVQAVFGVVIWRRFVKPRLHKRFDQEHGVDHEHN